VDNKASKTATHLTLANGIPMTDDEKAKIIAFLKTFIDLGFIKKPFIT